MWRSLIPRVPVLAVAVAAAAGLLSAGPASQPAGGEAGAGTVEQRAAALAERVLRDPLDAPVREQLEALRAQQRKADRVAFLALAQGLRAYLEAGPELAGPALVRASGSGRAVSLARPLGKSIARLLSGEVPAGPSAPARAPCAKCGDTGQADCTVRRCNGSGWVPCDACTGRGMVEDKTVAPGRQVFYVCRDCAGAGAVRCQECMGRGTVPCPLCKSPSGRWAQRHLLGDETAAIDRAIIQARWLGKGGIDLYTDGALKPSPK